MFALTLFPLHNVPTLILIGNILKWRDTNAEVFNGEQYQIESDFKIRTDYVISSTVESNRIRCALRCHGNNLCIGVNFKSASGHCELCSVGGYPSFVESRAGWQTITTTNQKPEDCHDVLTRDGSSTTGVYSVYSSSLSTYQEVFCDMDTDGGGWTIFQMRQTGDVDFNKAFNSYKQGFGTAGGDHWLGLDMLNAMTTGHQNDLQLHFTDFLGDSAYEKYDAFTVGAGPLYQLSLGSVTFYNDTQGTAGTNSGGTYTAGDTVDTQCHYIDSILAYSSQWNTGLSSANQITGAPDVYPEYGDLDWAWCPAEYTSIEFLEMRIATPLLITSVTLYETYEPGSLTRIATRASNGQWQTLWSTSTTSVLGYARMFSPSITSINGMTTDIRLELDVTNSWYQLDAVKVCGTSTMAPFQTMKYNDGASFTTTDNDADENAGNCANLHTAGWWFKDCTYINPNGAYTATGTATHGLGGMIVPGWKGHNTVQSTKLMFRRRE